MKDLYLTTDELRRIAKEVDLAISRVGVRVQINNHKVILERTTTGFIFVKPFDARLVIIHEYD